ncbi:MAG: MATE family efflux transporter [Oscillospiraceae bacterium]|jgi:putative MATE family efflux protein|nr:MATE family efflux transporter [Oscillospiraceae bacterium]
MVRDKSFYKTLIVISLPAALQSVISFSKVTVDTIMVGQLGDLPLAGVAISNQVITFLFAILLSLGSGSSVLIAQYWGKRDTATIKKVFALVVILCSGIGIIAMLVALLFPAFILGLMTNEQDIINTAIPYFTIISFSFAMYAASSALVTMFRNMETVMAALWISLFTSALNIFLNRILIFGGLGFPAMGIRGAAIGTVIARFVELSLMLGYALLIQKKIHLKIKDLFVPKLSIVVDYIKHGIPIALGDSQWAFFTVVKAAIIGHLGTVMVSANAIADTIMSIGYIGSTSLAAGACVVIGKAVGSGEYKKAREYSNTIQILFAALAVIMAFSIFLLRIPIVDLFVISESVRSYSIQMVAIGAFTLLGTLYHASCFVGINRGAGDGRFVAKVDFVCAWIIVLPLLFLSAHVWQLSFPLVFLAARFDQCFKWIIAFFRLKGNKWIRNVTN